MIPAQPSLWDNEALESGYRTMADLKLVEAVQYFNEALQAGFGGRETTQEAIDACYYWQPRIKKNVEINALAITNFLADYKQYPFSRLMTGLKKALLRYFVDCMSQQANLNWDEMEIAFDLLLGLKDYQKAGSFISFLISQNIEKRYLLYFLAQAQWLNGQKAASNDSYILALLHQPDKSFIERIENKKLQSLINSYGPAMAPAYCLLFGIVPVVPVVNNIEFCDEEHAKAIRSLYLLREANKALANNDRASIINSRKQLKAENPALYGTYFNVLKQNK